MSVVPDSANTEIPLHDEAEIATCRKVYPTDRGTVIKVPRDGHGPKQNRKEVEHWNEFGDERIMAPIVDHSDGYYWIEQAACLRLPRGDEPLNAYRAKLARFDAPISDLHPENIGVLPSNREIVCFDYHSTDTLK